jgi:hypothetical protein
MAQEEDKEKAEGEAPPPETILETEKQRDPDEAAFAEQAIHEYAEQVLANFGEGVQNAIAAVTAWVESQEAAEIFDNPGFNAQIGDAFMQQMLAACGGKDTPIGAALFEQLDGMIDQHTRDDHEASYFLNDMGAAGRDFAWYLRDNLSSVLSNEWDQVLDLAYEGSTDFIPALHAFGLPQADWAPAEMQSALVAIADKVKQGAPKTQEEAVEKDPKQEEEEQKQTLLEEEEKKQTA